MRFAMLGINMILDKLPDGIIECENKADRIDDIAVTVNSIILSSKCSQPLAATLRGKLQFSSNQFFARCGVAVMALLADHS